jgi:hypothetical protein
MAATDAEWARDVERRLKALERASAMRVGQWTITQQGNGSLWALGDDGRQVRLAQSIVDMT